MHTRVESKFAVRLKQKICPISIDILLLGWEAANASSIFKKGRKYTEAKHRPVSVTAIAYTMYDSIISMGNMTAHNLVADKQHSLIVGRICNTRLLETMTGHIL